jgi:hypothetical protein
LHCVLRDAVLCCAMLVWCGSARCALLPVTRGVTGTMLHWTDAAPDAGFACFLVCRKPCHAAPSCAVQADAAAAQRGHPMCSGSHSASAAGGGCRGALWALLVAARGVGVRCARWRHVDASRVSVGAWCLSAASLPARWHARTCTVRAARTAQGCNACNARLGVFVCVAEAAVLKPCFCVPACPSSCCLPQLGPS